LGGVGSSEMRLGSGEERSGEVRSGRVWLGKGLVWFWVWVAKVWLGLGRLG